jgi:hypothetical protein
MKTLIKSISSVAAALVFGVLTSCSPESFDGMDQSKLPQASDIDVTVTVDPETNQYTLTLNNKGVYPVWTIHTSDTKTITSTRNSYTGIITTAGTYPVEVRMGNYNGLCEGSKTYEIQIDKTIVDFAPYIRRITNGDSKTWMIASDVAGHLGCGPSGTDGLEWWSASANEKAGTGLYENRFTFAQTTASDGGAYTYDPGTSGTVYVNTGIASLPPYTDYNPGDGNDYAAPAQLQNVDFQFKTEGTDLYLVFPAGTLLGYIPNADAYNTPKFKVNSITNDNVELTVDNGEIAWHYILGLEGEGAFTGFKYNSEYNLWRTANIGTPTFWYAPGWNQIADPEYTLEGSTYTVSLPDATSDQWQAQMLIPTDLSSSSSNSYDFSIILNANLDQPHVTVKLVDASDDGIYFCADQVALTAYEDYVYYFSDVQGIDSQQLKLVLDFGGNPAGSVITARDIVFKNHANDDGTVLPAEDDTEASDVSWVDVNSDNNLWKGASYSNFFYYAPGWAQIADPEMTVDGNTYTIDLPSATFSQWQAQIHFKTTNIATVAGKKYDFRVTLMSTTDVSNATVKLTEVDNDELFYFTERVDLPAYEEVTLKCVNMDGLDLNPANLVFDFGGNPDNTKVTISNIILQEHVGE